jgi:lysophospholipase L1-like esterase
LSANPGHKSRSRVKRLGAGLVTAALMLAAAEGTSRMLTGEPVPELVAQMPDGSDRFFDRTDTTLEPLYQKVLKEGPIPITPTSGTPRVIWLGGSSLRGADPSLEKAQEAAAQVGALLSVETVNLAAPGMDTGLIVGLLPDVLALQPSAVVIYTGHNDIGTAVFAHRYGDARTVWVAHTRQILGGLRLFQLLEVAMRGREIVRFPTPQDDKRFRMTPAIRSAVRQRFKERLGQIVRTLRAANVPVVVSTVISNPVAPSLEWSCPDALKQLGAPHHRAEAFDVTPIPPEAVDAALAETGDCFDLRWLKARLEPDRKTATAGLDALRDEDELPVRADRATVELIRHVARQEGAVLVDAAATARQIGQGIEPPEWFNDPVHFSKEGEKAMAAILAPGVAKALGLPEPKVAIDPPATLGLSTCAFWACRKAAF